MMEELTMVHLALALVVGVALGFIFAWRLMERSEEKRAAHNRWVILEHYKKVLEAWADAVLARKMIFALPIAIEPTVEMTDEGFLKITKTTLIVVWLNGKVRKLKFRDQSGFEEVD